MRRSHCRDTSLGMDARAAAQGCHKGTRNRRLRDSILSVCGDRVMAKEFDIDLKPAGIAEVLRQHQLRVPPNQRSYAWRKEHIEQLFDDLADAFTKKGKKHYFLGTIVLNRTGDSDILEVSDGQQRLATTATFIAAIRDILEGGGNKSEKVTADKYTHTYLIEFQEIEGDWVPRIQLNTQDNFYFKETILISSSMRKQSSEGTGRRTSNERLAMAYALAATRIKKLQDAVSKEHRPRLLYDWIQFLSKNVIVIVIIVPEDVDAFTMFETLNYRGLRASQVDNIKNRLFKGAAAREMEIEDAWLSMISQIESFGNDKTVLDYLRHHWISRNGPTVERDLAKSFKEGIVGQAQVASFVHGVDDCAMDYEALFFAPLEHKQLNGFSVNTRWYIAATTRVLGIEQIRPLMMAIFREFTKAEAEKAFRIMLSWSMRFLIVGTGGGGYLDRNYGQAAAKISRGEIKSVKELRDEISNVPVDTQFEASFSGHTISDADIARYVCRSLEAAKRGEANPQIAFFDNPGSNNLEHILPRKPNSDWEMPQDIMRAYYKRIGNLTIFDPKANVDVGNSSFNVKKKEYIKSPFLITKELSTKNKWGTEEIEERQREFSKLAPQIWPLR
jgi:Protein of unknown function DUF262/Protein of unknown function (DUF1524)